MKLIIDIKVSDLSRAIKFYTEILGLSLLKKESNWASIAVGDAEIHLYINSGATKHVEFYVENIEEKVMQLKQKGVVFISGEEKLEAISTDKNHITTFPWGKTAFFKDSEDNELAIVEDF